MLRCGASPLLDCSCTAHHHCWCRFCRWLRHAGKVRNWGFGLGMLAMLAFTHAEVLAELRRRRQHERMSPCAPVFKPPPIPISRQIMVLFVLLIILGIYYVTMRRQVQAVGCRSGQMPLLCQGQLAKGSAVGLQSRPLCLLSDPSASSYTPTPPLSPNCSSIVPAVHSHSVGTAALGVLGAAVFTATVGMTLWSYLACFATEPGHVPRGWHPFQDAEARYCCCSCLQRACKLTVMAGCSVQGAPGGIAPLGPDPLPGACCSGHDTCWRCYGSNRLPALLTN